MAGRRRGMTEAGRCARGLLHKKRPRIGRAARNARFIRNLRRDGTHQHRLMQEVKGIGASHERARATKFFNASLPSPPGTPGRGVWG